MSTYVVEVSPHLRKRWTVKYKDLKTNVEEESEFDSVIVCIGKYSVPFVPKFHGLDKFKGSVIHSHDYRKMDPYRNKNVLLIGAGFSGIDIARALASVAKSVSIYLIKNISQCVKYEMVYLRILETVGVSKSVN